MVAEWQREAIEFADTIGEHAFIQQWTANALSKVTLSVMEQVIGDDGNPTLIPTNNAEAQAALASLFYGETGQSQMMAAFGHHLTTPGETWLVGVPPAEDGSSDDDVWRVLSILELTQQGSRWTIDRGDGKTEVYEDGSNPTKPAEALFIRIWRPHPMKWVEATSPVRAAIPILRELQGFTETVASALDSRLTGAGILLVPTEMSFATPATMHADPNDLKAQRDFLVELAEAFAAARKDLSSAAAQVPVLLRVPGQFIEKVQHIRLSNDIPAQAQESRSECIRRFALTMETDPQVLLGTADSNHWSAWLGDDNSIKMGVEPVVELITQALTSQFLWPALGDPAANPGIRRYVIVGDTSDLRQRPNRTAEAQSLHADFRISNAALLRECGFEEGDVPTAEEVQARLLLAVALGKVSPDLAADALAQLGVAVAASSPPAGQDTGAPPQLPAPPTPAAIDAPRTPPAPEQAAALQASGELLVTRALERANARLNQRRRRRAPITDDAAITAALHDAWGEVPRQAALIGVDETRYATYCEDYVRKLLHTGEEHTPAALSASLRPLLEDNG